jgi:hypothetical protein
MLPSTENVANFIAFAPDATEGLAFMYLEVRCTCDVIYMILLKCDPKNANTVDEAVSQFYENPHKYSNSLKAAPAASTSRMPPQVDNKATMAPSYSLPPYAPPTSGPSRPQHRHHTNPVIEAGKVRARDEVCSSLTYVK